MKYKNWILVLILIGLVLGIGVYYIVYNVGDKKGEGNTSYEATRTEANVNNSENQNAKENKQDKKAENNDREGINHHSGDFLHDQTVVFGIDHEGKTIIRKTAEGLAEGSRAELDIAEAHVQGLEKRFYHKHQKADDEGHDKHVSRLRLSLLESHIFVPFRFHK